MIEKIIGALQDALNSEIETVFELKQFNDDIYLVARESGKYLPLYQIKLEYTDKNELCDLIYMAITSKVVSNPAVNFIDHLCCGFGDTIHTDIWIELSESVILCILDKDCNFQHWIKKMKDKTEGYQPQEKMITK